MNKLKTFSTINFRLKHLLFASIAIIAFNMLGCSEDQNVGPADQGEIEGTFYFKFTGRSFSSVADSANFPYKTDTTTTVIPGVGRVPNVQFPGRFKIAVVPATDAGVPTAGPVSALPGLGDAPGVAFSRLSFENGFGVLRFVSSEFAPLQKFDNRTYVVAATYVNPYLTGQASQQFIGNSIRVSISGNKVTVLDTIDLKVPYDSLIAARNRINSAGVFTGSVTATNPANWPIGTGSPSDTNAYVAVTGYTTTPPGPGVPPALFAIVPRPVSGATASFTTTRPTGDYRFITLAIFKGFAPVAGGTLATYSDTTLSAGQTITLPTKTVTFP